MTKRAKRAARKQRLRELTVRQAKADKRTYLIWDAKQAHLALQVQPTGAKAWKCIYSRQGRPRWLHLGSADAIGLADARLMTQEAMLAVAKGKDPAAEKRAERSAGSFAELHQRYLDEHAKKHNKSWKQADALIRRHVLPRWAKLQAASISRSDVKQMIARIAAPISANQTLAAVSAVFTWGIREELVTANPCKLIERNPTRDRDRVLSESELPLFWQAFDAGTAGAAAGSALKAILLLGQRPGECAHMRREHIKDGWWEMPGEPVPELGWPGTKNEQSHRVWLPAPVQTLIGNRAATGFVFAGDRARAVRDLDAVMRDICAKLGVDRATPHDLRRTHGTTITKLKFGRAAMNRIQNHREGGIADVYDVHDYADENKHIMEAVAAKILGLAEGRGGDNVVQFR